MCNYGENVLVPAKIRILTALLEPSSFTDVVQQTKLSPATVSKWLKLFQAMGLVGRSRKGMYYLTDEGLGFLRNAMTVIVEEALKKGLVTKITLAVIPDEAQIKREGKSYVIIMRHYGEYGATDVNIDLGDEEGAIKKFLEKIAEAT